MVGLLILLLAPGCTSLVEHAPRDPEFEASADATTAHRALPAPTGTRTSEAGARSTTEPREVDSTLSSTVVPQPTEVMPSPVPTQPSTATHVPTSVPTSQPTPTATSTAPPTPIATLIPQPTATPPPALPAPTHTSTPAPDPLWISAFCNYGPTSEEGCAANGSAGVYADLGWDLWANVVEWEHLLLELDGVPYSGEEFGIAFASLAPGSYRLRLHERRNGVTVISEPTWFTILMRAAPVLPPPNPFAAECATYMAALSEARATGAAAPYIAWVQSQVAFYCN